MKTMITLIAILFYSNCLIAQINNYYTETKEFIGTDYIYQCELDSSGIVCLYDKENKLTYGDMKFKDTGKTFIPEDENIKTLTYRSWLEYRKTFYALMECAFSESEISILKDDGREFYLEYFINTETGSIEEIKFLFLDTSAFVYIPVSVYRNIELQLKRKCRFVITEAGKNINYVYLSDAFKFK